MKIYYLKQTHVCARLTSWCYLLLVIFRKAVSFSLKCISLFICFFYWFYFFLYVILWSSNTSRVHDVSSIFTKISINNQIKIFVYLLNSKGWLWFLCLRFPSSYCHSKFEIILVALTFWVECFEITSKVLCLLENFDLF